MAVIRLSNEPIIVTSFDDTMDEHQVIDLYMQSIKMAQAIDGPVYRVIDLREAPESAKWIVSAVGELARGLSGAAVVPNLAIVFVGDVVQSEYQSFDTLEAALEYARAQVAEPAR